jgi:hypothetical protein
LWVFSAWGLFYEAQINQKIKPHGKLLACSCDAACPCWFGSKPTRMTCSGGQVLFIEKGNYGNVKLDGLAVANMGQSPAGRSMMESFGDWNFSYNYVDEKATPEQRNALEAISAHVLVPGASKKTETRYVPITRRIDGKEHQITLGQYGTFHGHLIEGGLGGSPKVVNPPGADPSHKEYAQGHTSKITYNDADQNWSWDNSNYMFGTFAVRQRSIRKIRRWSGAENGAGEGRKGRPTKIRSTILEASPAGWHSHPGCGPGGHFCPPLARQ